MTDNVRGSSSAKKCTGGSSSVHTLSTRAELDVSNHDLGSGIIDDEPPLGWSEARVDRHRPATARNGSQRLATARNGSQRLATKYSARKSKLFLGDDRNPRLRLDVVGVRVTDNQ
ncbi:MAG: hypothetical protein ACI8V4_000530 [Ilumatobacter sp.]|jgi:hypothetical protein